MARSFGSATKALALAGALLFLLPSIGCGKREQVAKPPPAAFEPFAFRDIPVPPGFRPDQTRDQLALSIAGGNIRRYDGTYIRLKALRGPDNRDTQGWYKDRLQSLGWSQQSASDQMSRWHKDRVDGVTEKLVVETGRRRGDDIVRLTLVPLAP